MREVQRMSDFEKAYLTLKRLDDLGAATVSQISIGRWLYFTVVKKVIAGLETAGYVKRVGNGATTYVITPNGKYAMEGLKAEEGKLWISVIKE